MKVINTYILVDPPTGEVCILYECQKDIWYKQFQAWATREVVVNPIRSEEAKQLIKLYEK